MLATSAATSRPSCCSPFYTRSAAKRAGPSILRRVSQAQVADLRTQIEHRHTDRADVGLDVLDPLLDAAVFHGSIEHEAGGRPAFGLDLGHQRVQAGFVAAARQTGVVALAGKALGDVANHAGASTQDQADGFVHRGILRRCGGGGQVWRTGTWRAGSILRDQATESTREAPPHPAGRYRARLSPRC